MRHIVSNSASNHAEDSKMTKNVWFWVTVASGAIAAYLMYRRGENLSTIAEQAVHHPVSSLIQEAKNAA